MTTNNLHRETAATLKEWRVELASMAATRCYANHTDLRRRYGKTRHTRFQQIIETLLAHLTLAIQQGRPALFADYVLDDDARPARGGLRPAQLTIVLEQMRGTLRQYLPGPRGKLAYESLEFALARHIRSCNRSDQPLRNVA